MTITTRFQRIGDLAAGTMVIVDRARRAPWDLQPDDPRAFGLADLIPHSFVPNYMLTQSIGMYMESRRKLPMARRLEVARHLAGPLLIKFDMLRDTSPDLLLCAIFVRIFMSEQQQEAGRDALRKSQARTGVSVTAKRVAPQPIKPSEETEIMAELVTRPVESPANVQFPSVENESLIRTRENP